MPFEEISEHQAELNNEFATLLTLDCMLLFIQDVTRDNELLLNYGLVIIGISCLNFAVNTLPILC